MTRLQAMMAGLLGSLVAFAGLAAFLLVGLGAANASPPAQTQPPAAATTEQQKPGAFDEQHYADLLVQNMATRLGVDQAKLNAAFTAAAADTIDQAVKDGAVPQADAAKAKSTTGTGLSAFIVNSMGTMDKMDKMATDKVGTNDRMDAAIQGVQDAIAQRLGLTTDQFNEALRGGQTLVALEQAHGVTPQQIRDAALTAARTTLNNGVQKGKWTQAQADETYGQFTQNVDNLLMKLSGIAGARPVDDPQIQAIITAVEGAVAQTLGLTLDQLNAALGDTQALPALEQAHSVTHQQVQAASVAAAQAALATGVQQQKWTQAQADALAPDLSALVNKVLTKMGAPPPASASPKK